MNTDANVQTAFRSKPMTTMEASAHARQRLAAIGFPKCGQHLVKLSTIVNIYMGK